MRTVSTNGHSGQRKSSGELGQALFLNIAFPIPLLSNEVPLALGLDMLCRMTYQDLLDIR